MPAHVVIASTHFIAENNSNDKKVFLTFLRLCSCVIVSDVAILDQG